MRLLAGGACGCWPGCLDSGVSLTGEERTVLVQVCGARCVATWWPKTPSLLPIAPRPAGPRADLRTCRNNANAARAARTAETTVLNDLLARNEAGRNNEHAEETGVFYPPCRPSSPEFFWIGCSDTRCRPTLSGLDRERGSNAITDIRQHNELHQGHRSPGCGLRNCQECSMR